MRYQLARSIKHDATVWIIDEPPKLKSLQEASWRTGQQLEKRSITQLGYDSNVLDEHGARYAVATDNIELLGQFIEDAPLISFDAWKAAGYQAMPNPPQES